MTPDTILVTVLANVAKLQPIRFQMVFDYQTGMRWRRGNRSKVLSPGPHFGWSWWPLFHDMEVVDITERTLETQVLAVTTKDGKDLNASMGVRFNIIDISRFWKVNDHIGSLLNEAEVKMSRVVSRYECDQLLVKLEQIEQEVRNELAKRSLSWGIKVHSVGFINRMKGRSLRLFGDGSGGDETPIDD